MFSVCVFQHMHTHAHILLWEQAVQLNWTEACNESSSSKFHCQTLESTLPLVSVKLNMLNIFYSYFIYYYHFMLQKIKDGNTDSHLTEAVIFHSFSFVFA